MRKLSLLSVWALLLLSQNLLSGNNFGNGTSKGFIENKGQVHDQNLSSRNDVKFILPLGGMNLILKNDGFSYDTYKINAVDQSHNWEDLFTRKTPEKQSNTCSYHRVDIEFAGANTNPQIIAEGKSKDYLNFYGSGLGENGVTDVRIYQKVIYKNIYPNIDVEFVNENNNAKPAEFNFVLCPGANISDIRLKYKGASSTELVKGELKLNLQHGTLTETIPLSYWQRSHKKEKISYVLTKQQNGEVMITYSGLNKPITETLVIDPTPNLDWATYYGGVTNDNINSVSYDASGNLFICGATSSLFNIATSGAFNTAFGPGFPNGFIAKFTRNGTRIWGTYYSTLSPTDMIRFFDSSVDKNGDLYVSGEVQGQGLASAGAHQTTQQGGADAFLAKFNTAGTRLWATYYGGVEYANEYGGFVRVDKNNNVHLSGSTSSTLNIATPGSYHPNIGGSSTPPTMDGFLAKFSPAGVRQWATYLGGYYDEKIMSMTADTSGNIYIGGITYSSDSISTPGVFHTTYLPNQDGFVMKFNSNGNRMWGTYYGAYNVDGIWDICADYQGNVLIAGTGPADTAFISANAYQTSPSTSYVAKLNSFGRRVWGTYIGSYYPTNTEIRGIECDSLGNVYVTGSAKSPNNVVTPGCYQLAMTNSFANGFIAKYDSTGNKLFGTLYGGNSADYFGGIAIMAQNEIYITGETYSTAGLTTPWGHQPNPDPSYDQSYVIGIFAKFSNTGAVGIDEFNKAENENDILIYPNPNNGEFTIRTKEEMELTIYNELGQLVRILKIDNKERVNFNCKNGIYFINGLNKSGKRISKKIVILN